MKIWFLLLIGLLLFQNVNAQTTLCNHYHLFAVKIIGDRSPDNLRGLKLILVNEQEQPVTKWVTYYENSQPKTRLDTIFFQENDTSSVSSEKKTAPGPRFPHLGNCYLASFFLPPDALTNPSLQPLFQVKILGNASLSSELKVVPQLLPLPLGRAVELCSVMTAKSQGLRNLHQQPFQPIIFRLNASEQEVAVNHDPVNGLAFVLRYEYQTLPATKSSSETYHLKAIHVHETQTGKRVQTIPITGKIAVTSQTQNPLVEFRDFYQRGQGEAKDFSVLIASWKDSLSQGFRSKRAFYLFNNITRRYELDSFLHTYDDVFFHEPSKTFRRYDIQADQEARTVFTYELNNKQWKLIDRNVVFFKPPTPKLPLPLKQHLQVDAVEHFLPVVAAIEKKPAITPTDTFWIYNSSTDTLLVKQVQSNSRDFFQVNQTLLPQQHTAVIFQAQLVPTQFDFHLQRYHCTLILEDGSGLLLTAIVPTVSNGAAVYYRKGANLEYAIGQKAQARFQAAVLTYPDGTLRANGTIQDRDTSLKVGSWWYYPPNSSSGTDITYSKSLSLSALDDIEDYQHTRFQVKVKENGRWKTPVADKHSERYQVYLTPSIDSVLAYTDSTQFGFSVKYKKLPSNMMRKFYLLKPGERTMRLGYYQLPFRVYPHQYALLPAAHLKEKQRQGWLDSLMNVLYDQFPGIDSLPLYGKAKGINLAKLPEAQRYELLRRLEQDTNIAVICQLFSVKRHGKPRYTDNNILAAIDLEEAEDFAPRAKKLGFSQAELDESNHYLWLTYPQKLLDERYFETLQRLTQQPKVLEIQFNPQFSPRKP